MRKLTVRNILRALSNPAALLGEFEKQLIGLNRAIYTRFQPNTGSYVVDEDWDTLVILDACRFDMFQQYNELDGTLKKIRSRGSSSWEFMRENFADRQFHDTVYVSANPFINRLVGRNIFHDVIDVFDAEWDEAAQTVTPETMTAASVAAHHQYPNKRIICHYMQPHHPFLGETGADLSHTGVAGVFAGNQKTDWTEPSVWGKLQYNLAEFTVEEVHEAYVENLKLCFPHIRELLDNIDGKAIVTSDHGNLLGTRTGPIPVRTYGHPAGIHCPELVEVPWLECPYTDRREITAEEPVAPEQVPQSAASDRLRQLGYLS
jgi:hypothetical protein